MRSWIPSAAVTAAGEYTRRHGPRPSRCGLFVHLALSTVVFAGLAACDGSLSTSPADSGPSVSVPPGAGSDTSESEGPVDEEDTGSDPGPEESEDSTSPYPNEPTGFSRVAETSYAAPREGGFSSSINENFSIVQDGGAPRSPSTVARARFPAGLGDGVSPIWSEAVINGHGLEEVYVSYWLKISDNWQGHNSTVNKTAIIWTHEKPVVVANISGTDDSRLSSEVRIQDVPDGARNMPANLSDPEIVRGRWHRWELLLVSNTGDSVNGEIHWWIDGQKAGEYRDVRFGRSSQSKIWNYAAWRPVWGGRGDTVVEEMFMWMDHYYVSGRSW